MASRRGAAQREVEVAEVVEVVEVFQMRQQCALLRSTYRAWRARTKSCSPGTADACEPQVLNDRTLAKQLQSRELERLKATAAAASEGLPVPGETWAGVEDF